jgi:uncharacterized protein (TIGR02246 family)
LLSGVVAVVGPALAGLLAALLSLCPVLLAGAVPAGALSPEAQTCAAIDEIVVAALFQGWAEAVASGDAEAVASLYADDALLLPTLSADLRHDHSSIAAYFKGFLARHPSAAVMERQVLDGCNEVVDAGLYRFTFHDERGEENGGVLARYTLIYRYSAEGWRLVHHHSSLVPG